MKKVAYLFLLLLISLPVFVTACNSASNQDILYQTSTLNALMEGVYDGTISLKEVKQQGNFGVGTFDNLDGEMVVLDGRIYQIKSDGKVYLPEESTETPFVAVTFFNSDQTFNTENIANVDQMTKLLDSTLQTSNIFYAVKIDGSFDYMKTRSVPRQNKPFPPLAKVTQSIFEFKNIEGTIIGLRCPAFSSGFNLPGYHFHFISKDKKGGGHVIDFKLRNAKVEIDATEGFYMELPPSPEFYQLDLTGAKQDDVNRIEKGGAGN